MLVDLAKRSNHELEAIASIDAFGGASLCLLKWAREIDFIPRVLDRMELLARVLESAGGEPLFRMLMYYALCVGRGSIAPTEFLAQVSRRLPKLPESTTKTLAEILIDQ